MLPERGSFELRKARYDGPQTCMVTSNTAARRELAPNARDTVINAILWLREHRGVLLHAFVVMPDHFHILLSNRSCTLDELMHSLKGFTAHTINKSAGTTGAVWQEGYREDGAHNTDMALSLARYLEDNPLAAGLVRRPWDYPWSSAHDKWRGYVDPT
jgi:putative transposase